MLLRFVAIFYQRNADADAVTITLFPTDVNCMQFVMRLCKSVVNFLEHRFETDIDKCSCF